MKRQSHLAIGIGLSLIVACITTQARADAGKRHRRSNRAECRKLANVGDLLGQGLSRAAAAGTCGDESRIEVAR